MVELEQNLLKRGPVKVIDSTLREGAHSSVIVEQGKLKFTIPERLVHIESLSYLGVENFEILSPRVNAYERLALQEIIRQRREIEGRTDRKVVIEAHARLEEGDIKSAIDEGVDGVNLYIGTSEIAQSYNHRLKIDDIIDRATQIISSVRTSYPRLGIRFSGEDFSRSDINDILHVYGSIEGWVKRFGMPDTVGKMTPEIAVEYVKILKQAFPNMPIGGHFHNDKGYAIINAVRAVQAGMDYVDTTIFGIGERTGITSTSGLLFNLQDESPELVAGYDLDMMYPIQTGFAKMLSTARHPMQVPWNDPVSLTAITDVAGVHQAAQQRNDKVYRGFDYDIFGVTAEAIMDPKLNLTSGYTQMAYVLEHVHGFVLDDVTRNELRDLAQEVRDRASLVPDHEHVDINAILNSVAIARGIPKLVKPQMLIEPL